MYYYSLLPQLGFGPVIRRLSVSLTLLLNLIRYQINVHAYLDHSALHNSSYESFSQCELCQNIPESSITGLCQPTKKNYYRKSTLVVNCFIVRFLNINAYTFPAANGPTFKT